MITIRPGIRNLARSCVVAVAAAVVLGAAARAWGAPATPAVAQAEARDRQGLIDSARGAEALRLAQTFLRDGQLPDAASTADRLLHDPDNGRELLAEAYVVRGRTAARLGDAPGAEAQFRRALELRPSAQLTDAVPAESAAFEAARRTVAPGGLRLVQAPVGEVPAGKPSEISLTVEGDGEQMVATLELGYRRGDGGAFVTARSPYAPIAAPAGTTAGASAGGAPIASGPRAPALVIPAAALVAGTHVEYWVRALNAQGSVLAESGTATLPFRLQVAAPAIAASQGAGVPASTPWFKRWWVWTIVGAVAIGGGAAAYAGTRGGGDGLTTYMTQTKQ